MSDDLGDIKDIEVLRHLFPGSPEEDDVKSIRPYSMVIEPKDFENRGRYKYVRFQDGKILFSDAGDIHVSHIDVVKSRKGHAAITAGTIKVKDGKWAIVDRGSVSAKLPCGSEDEDHLLRALAPMFIYDVEVSYW